MRAAIIGISGPALLDHERKLLLALPPAGVILFSRNIVDPPQLRALRDALRAALPSLAVLMVDQEGGRVARLKPPHWRAHPPAASLGARFEVDPAAATRAAWLTGALIGLDCAAAGFDVVTAPVLDRRIPDAHEVIGDRALSEDPAAIVTLGRAIADGLLAAGVQPVMKHIPGHGQTNVDSHLELPHYDGRPQKEDLDPFTHLADLHWAITAHILYSFWDTTFPVTLSPGIISGIIRKRIGFRGVLMTDDLAMNALTGTPAERAGAALAAGCDIALFCPGDHAGNEAVLRACPVLSPRVLDLMTASRTLARTSRIPLDGRALAEERDQLLA